jgi:hypothetical protein
VSATGDGGEDGHVVTVAKERGVADLLVADEEKDSRLHPAGIIEQELSQALAVLLGEAGDQVPDTTGAV